MEQELIELGFTSSEAKIYIEVLKNQDILAGDLSKKTGINRRTVYDSLNRMEEKGLIGHNITSNKKHYFAINPESIVKNIESMKESAMNLLPRLKEITQKESGETNVILYKGRKGIRNILNMVLESKKYVSYGTTKQFPNTMEHHYDFFQNMKEKKKISSRVILSKTLKGEGVVKSVSSLTKIKFLSEKITGPSSTFIFEDKVAIFVWEKPYFGILLDSKKVHDSYLEYFEELWKIAEK